MSGNGKPIFSRIGLASAGLLIVVGLSACVEDEIGPQFANNPPTATVGITSGLPTATAATPSAMATPVAPATPVTIQDVLGTRGSVQRIFLASSATIWAIDDDGQSEAILDAEPDEQILAIGPSPDSSQVAALVSWDGGRESSLVVIEANGDLVTEVDLPAGSIATPVGSQGGAGTVSVDWSPQGDQILLLHGNGEMLTADVSNDFALNVVDLGVPDGSIREPAWSPTGQQIAFVAVNPDTRTRALNVFDFAEGQTTELVGSDDGRLVVDFAWEPGGREILFTEGSALNSAITGIDLWSIHTDGTGRELVAAAGAVAPVAQIANVTPSTDGKSVAYAILVPTEGAPAVDSVWIRDLATDQAIRLGLPSVRSVGNIWWTSRGLAIETVADRRGQPMPVVLLVAPGGNVSALWAAPQPVSAASPVPLGSPDASDENQVEATSP